MDRLIHFPNKLCKVKMPGVNAALPNGVREAGASPRARRAGRACVRHDERHPAGDVEIAPHAFLKRRPYMVRP